MIIPYIISWHSCDAVAVGRRIAKMFRMGLRMEQTHISGTDCVRYVIYFSIVQ